MVSYDASVIEKFATKLYRQAGSVVFVATVAALFVGAAAGAAIGSGSRDSSGGLAVGGAIVFGAIGYYAGQARAFARRLQAQVALCQVKIERNTRSSAGERSTS